MESKDQQAPDGDSVVAGSADKTPLVALGATAAIVAVVFVCALGLAALAYLLAS